MTRLHNRVPSTCSGAHVLGRYQGVQVRSRGVLAAPAQVQCCAHTPKTAPRRRIAPQAVSAPPSSSSISKVFDTSVEDAEFLDPERPMKVLIAGGGIAGLVLAVALLKKGVDVRIFEQDMTAIRGEGKYRGPIQVQSNALAALEAIDPQMAAEVMDQGCVTGDRINGLCDGISGDWYCKFDTYHPAVNNGLPVTRVISRVTLQQILAKYAENIGGDEVIQANTKVDTFSEDSVQGHDRVWAELKDGSRQWGDVLIGADGIWSKVRKQLIGETPATYSGYTCYTGISDFVCHDIDTVAYRVFLGNGQYFVSSDVGGGKMQWYAFHEEPAGSKDETGTQKARLLDIFGKWNDMVTDLIAATPEGDVIRRDIFDRPPIFKWTKGRVALLGDSAHAMQPNLGQGGCMAIEDSYELGKLIGEAMPAAKERAAKASESEAFHLNIQTLLKDYQGERMMRASAIHGMARMAAVAASTYKAYLGEQFHLEDKIKILHPGRVMGQLVLGVSMPMVLGWVLGGNTGKLNVSDRAQYCTLDDQPRGFGQNDWDTLMKDDEALLRASHALWVLASLPAAAEEGQQEPALVLEEGVTIGCGSVADVHIEGAGVQDIHASIHVSDDTYFIEDAGSSGGTFLNNQRIKKSQRVQLHPGDFLAFGEDAGVKGTLKVKLLHSSQREDGLLNWSADGTTTRTPVTTKVQ